MKRFPVLDSQRCRPRDRKPVPREVPWAFAESFRKQAERNHDQTLERLAERGGLSPQEIWIAAHGHRLFSESVDEPRRSAWCLQAGHDFGVRFGLKHCGHRLGTARSFLPSLSARAACGGRLPPAPLSWLQA